MNFDDKTPDDEDVDEENPEEYYKMFGEVFKRNSVWSKVQPVPVFGGDETVYQNVEKFYKFWRNFDSWRDFPQDDEHDLDEAENRWERRQMEKENMAIKKELLKEEKKRII